jgi:hypothetical protein
MITRFIGDVHGKFSRYKRIIATCDRSIQVGDMGIGFRHSQGPRVGELQQGPPHAAMIKGDHRFIRGNHDNPVICAGHSQWIPDGNIESGVMFIGGAISIDKEFRFEGYSWWPEEELSRAALDDLVEVYCEAKPRIMVTHDAPQEVAAEVSRMANWGVKLDPRWSSRTREALQAMWSAHAPEMWIFGHWHFSFDRFIRGTHFVCLAELECIDVDI